MLSSSVLASRACGASGRADEWACARMNGHAHRWAVRAPPRRKATPPRERCCSTGAPSRAAGHSSTHLLGHPQPGKQGGEAGVGGRQDNHWLSAVGQQLQDGWVGGLQQRGRERRGGEISLKRRGRAVAGTQRSSPAAHASRGAALGRSSMHAGWPTGGAAPPPPTASAPVVPELVSRPTRRRPAGSQGWMDPP